jgi:hypothetical protein
MSRFPPPTPIYPSELLKMYLALAICVFGAVAAGLWLLV